VEREKVKDILMMLLVVLLITGVPLISHAGEATVKSQEEKVAPVKPSQEKEIAIKPESEKQAILNIKAGSGNKLNVDLTNTVPVRGMQFTLSGVKITEVRTTERAAGFLAKFNEENGMVILISTAEARITPGEGPIAEVICDKLDSASLSGIKIAGSNREPL
jgi:hypothetical protein